MGIAIANSEYQVNVGRVFVYAFDPSSDSWTPVGDPLMNGDCHTHFGNILKLTTDAHLLVTCGESWSFFSGTVYVYVKEEMGDAFVLQQRIVVGSGAWSLDVDNN